MSYKVMVVEQTAERVRVNARRTDAFDVFNLKFYAGPNPELNTSALVFDLAVTNNTQPLPLAAYVERVVDRYPHLENASYDSYAQLFARTAAEVSKLEMELHFDRFHVTPHPNYARIAVQALHARTSRSIIYTVWDWFEAITQGKSFDLDDAIEVLQGAFGQSVYGGPTVYALLKTAYEQSIPAFYLWDEGLMQYGYGKHQVRGLATTFDRDSHLDSDFTTRKDDCKAFLETLGFPVPPGQVVATRTEALKAADRIGYPVAVKPVVGHKGIGVTAEVRDEIELEQAFERAVDAIAPDRAVAIVVERSISGKDFRLLCVNGRFVAATERRPASVTGDGESTIETLIARENRTRERSDTPTSPLGKIKIDKAMERYLHDRGLTLDSVLERDRSIYLRKVANLSSGGLSINATDEIHPDNVVLAQDIARHFRLTCLGIDVIARDLSRSWKDGNFGILEINAAPGIFMHLKPAIGDKVDVTSAILKTFFSSSQAARIPTISFNRISVEELKEIVDRILQSRPDWTIGAVCQQAVFINRSEKQLHPDYNTNVRNLLRHPKLDLLIAEYSEAVLNQDGMFYEGSNIVVLDDPTQVEMMLARDVFEETTIVTKHGNTVSIRRQGLMEQYQLSDPEPFSRVYLKEIATIL